ncbi:galactose mutarotase [Neisseria perflava]|uniref:aldose epimerase family protein n=1 Tax=Neisseria perflava TaxID=33053 RepID=UPI00209E475B|nr:galactose mutarotase [Neisseria perflava]MCP1660189.1 aldose 1-epimerase [Neisseria perflava]MCP1771929.1 aldose 1-epimerase [Neisseria perflava]
MQTESFGTAYGRDITKYHLQNTRGTSVGILDLGGIVQDFVVKDKDGTPQNLVVSLPDAAAYESNTFQLNKQIGRVAGRIRGAAFELDGQQYEVEANEQDYCLHGGSRGFGTRVFDVTVVSEQELLLHSLVKVEEDGFPHDLAMSIRYRLEDDDSLTLEYRGTARGGSSVFDPTMHVYWQLADGLEHAVLQIPHAEHAVLDSQSLPTGEFDNNPLFDFSDSRDLAQAVADLRRSGLKNGLDEIYRVRPDLQKPVAVLDTGAHRIHIFSNRNGLVVFTAAPTDLAQHQAGYYCAVATEAQTVSDSLHHPQFGEIRLREDETRSAVIRYQVETL